jgi:hypothetical protein
MRLRCAVVAAALAAAGVGAPRAADEALERVDVPEAPQLAVRLRVAADHRQAAARYAGAAAAAIRTLDPWLGPLPPRAITIVDPDWHAPRSPASGEIVLERTPWWTTPTSMRVEIAVGRAVASWYWQEGIDVHGLPAWFLDGLAEYLARRIVHPQFERENNTPGYAMYEERDFGGFVPRFVRIRLMPESDGDPLPAYRAFPRADVAGPASASGNRALTAKTVLTLVTLERWLGAPAFDAVVAEFAHEARGRRPTVADFIRTASEASGQDLSWLFVQTLGGDQVFDYAIAQLESHPSGADAYESLVVVERRGDGVFSGAAAPRTGPFESGRGMTLKIEFADGQEIVETWDGRDARKTFRYRGPARARSAEIDPARRLALDVWRTNNGWTLRPRSRVAASRWAAGWMMWLENLVATYAFFV